MTRTMQIAWKLWPALLFTGCDTSSKKLIKFKRIYLLLKDIDSFVEGDSLSMWAIEATKQTIDLFLNKCLYQKL